MESIKDLVEKIKQRRPSKNLHTPAHLLADEISNYLGEKKQFAAYLGVIYRIGIPKARSIFIEIKDSKCKNPRALFFWKAKQ